MKAFIRNNKTHLSIWFLLFGATLFSGWNVYQTDRIDIATLLSDQPSSAIADVQITDASSSVSTSVRVTEESKPIAPSALLLNGIQKNTSSILQKDIEKPLVLPVTVRVLFSDYIFERAVAVPPSTSVFEALEKLRQEGFLEFSSKEFAGMGQFIESFDGIKNDVRGGRYWIYYINDQKATVGASAYRVQTGDVITWKYEKAYE